MRGSKDKYMEKTCVVIFGAGNGQKICGADAAGLLHIAGRSLVAWALDAALGCTADVFLFGLSADEIEIAGNMAQPLEGDACLQGKAKQYSRAVMLRVDQLISQGDMQKLCQSGAKCAVLVRGDNELPAWSIDVAALGADADMLCAANYDDAEYIQAEENTPAPIINRYTFSLAESAMQNRIVQKHFANGVSIIRPETVYIDADVEIGEGVLIWPNNTLTGKTVIGCGSEIKMGCNINNSTFGANCVLNYVYANDAAVGDNVTIGPYVNLRPNTVIADGCKIGDFVEVKNSNIGQGTKLPHLSYIGDADVGARVNVGCGCVFVNYDGVHKHRTSVGDDVFLGCQTNLVAPVTVGNGAYTAAGSTINKNVPADAMAFARARQENREGYASRYKALKKGEK